MKATNPDSYGDYCYPKNKSPSLGILLTTRRRSSIRDGGGFNITHDGRCPSLKPINAMEATHNLRGEVHSFRAMIGLKSGYRSLTVRSLPASPHTQNKFVNLGRLRNESSTTCKTPSWQLPNLSQSIQEKLARKGHNSARSGFMYRLRPRPKRISILVAGSSTSNSGRRKKLRHSNGVAKNMIAQNLGRPCRFRYIIETWRKWLYNVSLIIFNLHILPVSGYGLRPGVSLQGG